MAIHADGLPILVVFKRERDRFFLQQAETLIALQTLRIEAHLSTQKQPLALVRLPVCKTRRDQTDAHARSKRPVEDNVVQFRARSDARPRQARAQAKRELTPIWECDPIAITMALSLCEGNVGRAATLLETWQDEATLIGRSAKR